MEQLYWPARRGGAVQAGKGGRRRQTHLHGVQARPWLLAGQHFPEHHAIAIAAQK